MEFALHTICLPNNFLQEVYYSFVCLVLWPWTFSITLMQKGMVIALKTLCQLLYLLCDYSELEQLLRDNNRNVHVLPAQQYLKIKLLKS